MYLKDEKIKIILHVFEIMHVQTQLLLISLDRVLKSLNGNDAVDEVSYRTNFNFKISAKLEIELKQLRYIKNCRQCESC